MDGCRNRASAAMVRLPGTAYVPTGTEVAAMRMSPLRQASLYAMLLALACSHTPRLVPAPEAQRLSDDPGAAVASGAGVQVTIRSRSWQGEPRDLESIVTPVHVTVENGSAVAIQIRYRYFTLTSEDGLQTPA